MSKSDLGQISGSIVRSNAMKQIIMRLGRLIDGCGRLLIYLASVPICAIWIQFMLNEASKRTSAVRQCDVKKNPEAQINHSASSHGKRVINRGLRVFAWSIVRYPTNNRVVYHWGNDRSLVRV